MNQPLRPIDPRERYYDEEEKLRTAFEGQQAGLWTALPVIVVSYNADLQTCVLQPSIQALQRDQYANLNYVKLPILQDCPVIFPSGGGFTLTFPIAAGDEGLAIFASRCIDGWWQNGGTQIPLEIRMHDLSDGFYLPGARSKPRALSSASTTTTQLRSDDSLTYVEIAGGGVVNVAAPTSINLNTPVVNIAGIINVMNENSVSVPCNISGALQATGDILANSGAISLVNHVHTGVQPGSGNTGPATG